MNREDWARVRNLMFSGAAFAFVYAVLEYYVKVGTDDEQALAPLLVRATLAGACILFSVGLFEVFTRRWFRKRRFLFVVIIRSVCYGLIITGWLIVMNGVWFIIKDEHPFRQELRMYLNDDMYLINLLSIMLAVVLTVGVSAINSLHRRGELASFILGRYHKPREVDRIFCFIDLKDSTPIAEKLGHLRFATFLRDYFSDITEALRKTSAQIYQYVGDEIVLIWSFKSGIQDHNALRCFFLMQEVIDRKKQYYLDTYGEIPRFRAGVHGGKVIVTWVGELKKEIVYIGDVVNTTARIREDSKRTGNDFLISGDLLESVGPMEDIQATFVEETVPRGKAKAVRLYSLRHI